MTRREALLKIAAAEEAVAAVRVAVEEASVMRSIAEHEARESVAAATLDPDSKVKRRDARRKLAALMRACDAHFQLLTVLRFNATEAASVRREARLAQYEVLEGVAELHREVVAA